MMEILASNNLSFVLLLLYHKAVIVFTNASEFIPLCPQVGHEIHKIKKVRLRQKKISALYYIVEGYFSSFHFFLFSPRCQMEVYYLTCWFSHKASKCLNLMHINTFRCILLGGIANTDARPANTYLFLFMGLVPLISI